MVYVKVNSDGNDMTQSESKTDFFNQEKLLNIVYFPKKIILKCL